jgi:putative intracellular protease/amidase
MADDLEGMKVAILATDGVERIELEQPRGALYGAGAFSNLLSIHSGEIQARQSDLISAGTLPVDHLVTDVSVEDYDALLLPGGIVNPDGLRIDPDAVGFVKAFAATGKPVAAICHGPWTLIEASATAYVGPDEAVTRWLGEAGAGSRLKLVLNTWLAFLMEGIAESVAMADTIGVDHQALRDALQGSPVNAPVALLKLAKIDTGDESPDFSLRWATKDVDLALAEAGDQTLPVAAAIDRRWHALAEAGLGQADVGAVRPGLAKAARKS